MEKITINLKEKTIYVDESVNMVELYNFIMKIDKDNINKWQMKKLQPEIIYTTYPYVPYTNPIQPYTITYSADTFNTQPVNS